MNNGNVQTSVEFQEEYKRLDRLCKDTLQSEQGVTQYIEQMKKVAFEQYRHVALWEETLRQLKHVRWVRNQLAHEVGAVQSGVCVQDDLRFVRNFHQSIIVQKDPLALLRVSISQTQKPVPKAKTKTEKSTPLWRRIVKAIARVFFWS